MPHIHCVWLAIVLACLLATPGVAQSGVPGGAGQPTRLVSGIPSAQRILDDLRWVVVDLGGHQKVWDDILFPAADIFMIGVDPNRPVGTDMLFGKESTRKQFNVPIGDLGEFRSENLEPIDIQSRRRAADLYELTSKTLGYSGWMRLVDGYAAISTVKEDVPTGMPSPQKTLDALMKAAGYDAAAAIHNDAEGMASRKESFEEFRSNMLAGITKRPSETREAFELRKTLAEHQTTRLERLFVQAARATGGWITDTAKATARGEATLSALPGTELAAVLQQFGAEPSYFAGVPTSADTALSGRMRIPVDETLQKQADEFYKLIEPVWMQQIDKRDEITAAQKEARKQIMQQLLVMLKEGSAVQAIDAFVEMTPVAGGQYVIASGVRAADGTKAVEILKLLPAAFKDWSVELNVDEAEGVAIHRIGLGGETPASLKKYFGDAGEAFIGTSKEAVWVSGGPNALDHLKQTIAAAKANKPAANGTAVTGNMKLGVIVTMLDDIATEEGFSLEEFLGRTQPTEEDLESEAEGTTRKRRPGKALQGIDIKSVAIPVLKNAKSDRITIELKQEEGTLTGWVQLQVDVLKAAGKVIAKVAEEKLGG
jgi:hypothetical protein